MRGPGPIDTRQRLLLRLVAALAMAMTLTPLAPAHAGTYVIDNCPSAPGANSDPGPWTVFGAPQNTKGSCTGGPGNFIGPLGGSMSPGELDGVQVTAPAGSGITIRDAKVWWFVPHQSSGADTFALASVNTGVVEESGTPKDSSGTPEDLVLPSTTTELTLADYCSGDDAGSGCAFGTGENPDLELLGAQLTLADSRLPTAKVTGGGLASTRPLSGTQSFAYTAEDTDSGVRLVQLLIDGESTATDDYLSQCAYTDFQACPASESGTISWNTASVADGQHSIQAIVEDAAQNTSTFYDGTIITENAPSNSSPPSIPTSEQPLAGSALSALPGGWSAPAGAGSITYAYQWQDCDSQGSNCTSIPAAQGATYRATAGDVGRTLRALVTAIDRDGSSTLASTATAPVSAQAASSAAAVYTAESIPGTPNGTDASELAQLSITGPTSLVRAYRQRALIITGRLHDPGGTPIQNATLDVSEQVQGSSWPRVVAHANTSGNGTFTAHVPAGPSRVILIGYRALSTDAHFSAQATVRESVNAGVRMHITPRHTGAGGEITITGHVDGPLPAQGVVVVLLVHYRGRWEPFRDPRTSRTGRFRMIYQFEGGVGRFPFRAEVLGGQAGFPYVDGDSSAVAVRTG